MGVASMPKKTESCFSLVYLDVEGGTKEDVLQAIALFCEEKDVIPDKALTYREFLNYEKAKGTLAAGNEMALPTLTAKMLHYPLVCVFCRTKNPVDFNAVDGKPVRIVVASFVKDAADPQTLRAMVKISRRLKDADFRKTFLDTKNEDEILMLLKEVSDEIRKT